MKQILATVLIVCAFLPVGALAQSFSAGSINVSEGSGSMVECRSDALTLNQRLVTVRQIINTIIACNKNGEVYDSGSNSCVTPVLSPDHNFRFRSAGSTLELENSDDSFGNAVVIGGAPGADISCEPAPVTPPPVTPPPVTPPPVTPPPVTPPPVTPPPVTPPPVTPPPVTPDPAACRLPWGGTIAHGQTVTAYSQASVPSGGTCASQTRTCRDGTLSGSYTNRNCTVRKPVTTCTPWQWDFDGWCNGRPMCSNFNLLDKACRGASNCTVRNVRRIVNTCAVCNVVGERCVTR